jgi:hypothetical protein
MEESAAIAQIKKDFQDWNAAVVGKKDIPLGQAYLLLKQFLPYFPHVLFSDAPYPMTIYRARIIAKDSTEDIADPRTFSYPPTDKCTTYQRASVPGFPVFYGAMDVKTAIEELRTNSSEPIKKGDQFYLSEWKINKDVLCTFNCLTFSNLIGEQYLISDLTERVNMALDFILANTTAEFNEAQIFLYNQISQLFLTGSYLQSGPIAYNILYGNTATKEKGADGLLYPSCSNAFNSINCALSPDFVEQHMQMEVVRKMSFEQFEEQSAHSLGYYFGVIEDKRIIWKTYVTEFMGKYDMRLDLTLQWTDAEIEQAQFFVRNEEMDLTKFCEYRIDNIDFNAISISQEHEERYKRDGKLAFDFTFDMNGEDCYLKSAIGINTIKRLLISIPANAGVKSVDATLVRSS